MFLSKTWITNEKNFICNQITPKGYSINHVSCTGKTGSGVGIITQYTLKSKSCAQEYYATFEYAVIYIEPVNELTITIIVYRPPGPFSTAFIDDFTSLLETYALQKHRLLAYGDFNIHYEKQPKYINMY